MNSRVKKIFTFVGVVVLLWVTFTFSSLIKQGLFAKTTVADETIPAMTILSVSHYGAHDAVAPAAGKLFGDAQKATINGSVGFGIYYGNPELLPADSQKALIGLILSDSDMTKGKGLTEYQLLTTPEHTAKVVRFPFKGRYSIPLAHMKAFPKLKEACKKESFDAYTVTLDIPNKEMIITIPTSLSNEELHSWLAQEPVDETESDSTAVPEDSTESEIGIADSVIAIAQDLL